VFSDAFLPEIRSLQPSVLTLLTRGGTAELMQLFPALGDTTRAAPPSRGDPAELKARLLWNFAQFVGRYAAKRPLLIVLENLQWADTASLEMLHFVARQISGERVLVIATHNDPELRGANGSLRSTELSLRNLGTAERLRLTPLTVDDVVELLERRFRAEDSQTRAFAERLHKWTGGNGFFIDETLKSLVDAGQLREANARWTGWDVDELRVPGTIRETVLARLADLSTDARKLADIAAALGTSITHDELSAIAALDDTAMLAAIDELRTADVLAERELGGDIMYDFAHPLIQETLYADLGLARARTLHGAIAESLESLYGAHAMEHAGVLAYHYARGDARRLALKAVEYLRAAGRDALAKYASREAADYLTTALTLADQGAGADRELVVDLARVRQRLGDYAGAKPLWERALVSAREANDAARIGSIERSIGLAAYWTGAFNDALAHYDAAIEMARRAKHVSLEARVRMAKASCLQALGRTDESRAEIEAALGAATTLGNNALLARAHRAMLLLFVWTGPAERAREHGRMAIALAESSGQRNVAWSAHWALAMLGGLTGRAAEARRHLAEAHRIADDLRSPLFRAWTSEVEIEYAAGVGEWEHAVVLAQRTIDVARSLGQRTLLPRVLVWLGLLHFGRGDVEQGKLCVDEAWELAGGDGASGDVFSVVPAHIGRAAYHLAMQEYADAIRVGERGLEIAGRSGQVVWTIHRLMPIIAEASLWANDMERAKSIGARMRRESMSLGQQLGLAWADACDAVVELLAGDKQRAVSLLRGAIDALEAIPYIPDGARLRRQLARALAETGDRDGATRELRRAHEVFAHLGAQRELDETREQLRELGARPPTRSVVQGVAGLTGREVEIVRLVAARKSNKEIGVALGISARTASTHLSNIFSKLGVDSRGALADLARTLGLSAES
jgi:DNA-binding CsgD family transcriptional regulator